MRYIITESNYNKMFNSYLDRILSKLKPITRKSFEGNSITEWVDESNDPIFIIKFDGLADEMVVTISRRIYDEISVMFSFEKWYDLHKSITKWLQESFDGLENIKYFHIFDDRELDNDD